MLKKYKPNGEIEFAPAYFNSTTKTVINYKFHLENAFQEILYRIDNLISEGSGWIVELIESKYINISTYRQLPASSKIKLLPELINIKNNDQKCFLWCRVRHVNPVIIHPERITREDKELANDLNYDRVGFPVREKDLSKIETKDSFALMRFAMKISRFFQSTFQIKYLKIQWICYF